MITITRHKIILILATLALLIALPGAPLAAPSLPTADLAVLRSAQDSI